MFLSNESLCFASPKLLFPFLYLSKDFLETQFHKYSTHLTSKNQIIEIENSGKEAALINKKKNIRNEENDEVIYFIRT